jgi:FkbM family methyltransferase
MTSSAHSSALRAQHGEDAQLAARFGHKQGGYYVEVGALDGEKLSNTYYFEKELGWSGVLVEADPQQAESCRRTRPASFVANRAAMAPGAPASVTLEVAEGKEEFSTLSANRVYAGILAERNITTHRIEVPTATLDQILSDAGTQHIDFVTIDVEGHELDVMRGFDLARWRPTVVMIESAGGAPNVRIAVQLFRAGYARTRRIVINDWYEQVPLPQRVVRFALSYLLSTRSILHTLAREALRSLGLLEKVRGRRAARRAAKGQS